LEVRELWLLLAMLQLIQLMNFLLRRGRRRTYCFEKFSDLLFFANSSLIIFPDLVIATEGVKILKNTPVAAVEILDGPCLRSVSNHGAQFLFLSNKKKK
jgi:hypothetical protein